MKIKEYIKSYHDELKSKTDRKIFEGEKALSDLKKKLSRDEQSMISQVSFQRTQLKIAFDTKKIDQKIYDENSVLLDEAENTFFENRDELIKNQEEINQRSLERIERIVSVHLRKQIRDQLLNECVRLNQKVGFKGMPFHIQRFIKRWELIAVEIGDDPQRFVRTLQKEKSGVMFEPWKQYNEKRLLRIENRNLKLEIARLRNE